MPTLQETLDDATHRKAIIADCLVMIDEEVAAKGGLSGLAVKAGYKAVKGIRPGFIEDTVDTLLDDFAKQLQPIATDAAEKNQPVGTFFVANKSRVADALLHITDERAKRSTRKMVKGAYEKLRPTAKKNVEDAVPRLGRLVEKYTR